MYGSSEVNAIPNFENQVLKRKSSASGQLVNETSPGKPPVPRNTETKIKSDENLTTDALSLAYSPSGYGED
jgi:hypothetical protein